MRVHQLSDDIDLWDSMTNPEEIELDVIYKFKTKGNADRIWMAAVRCEELGPHGKMIARRIRRIVREPEDFPYRHGGWWTVLAWVSKIGNK